MNSQLELHTQRTETFSSDEVDVTPPEKDIPVISPIIKAAIVADHARRELHLPKKLFEPLKKLVFIAPLVMVVGDYIGLKWSMLLASLILILLQRKPPKSFVFVFEPAVDHPPLSPKEHVFIEKKRKFYHECRMQVAHLIGLVGAPPLPWRELDPTLRIIQLDHHQTSFMITEAAVDAIRDFCQAHVQLLLTVDRAYHFLQISASLHMGLGPQSQCVERVERATISKEYREKKNSLDLRQGVAKSILSLSSVRTHVAQIMVEQSESLASVMRATGILVEKEESMGEVPVPAGNKSYRGLEQSVEIPDIVTLSWIKAARQQLAAMLSHVLDRQVCTIPYLEVVSNQESHLIEESMWNARQAMAHLQSTLLLDTTNTASSIEVEQPRDPLIGPLLQIRDQLDALQGALWACHQSNDKNGEGDEVKNAEKKQWWSQVRNLSAVVRAMEQEIDESFFPNTIITDDYSENEGEDSETKSPPPNQNSSESDRYEHLNPTETLSQDKTKTQEKTTKTIVFSGSGAVAHKPRKPRQGSNSKSTGVESAAAAAMHRDTVVEQLMVRELQNRIKTLCSPEEEESGSLALVEFKLEQHKVDSKKDPRQPAMPLFLGASGSLLSELKQSMPTTMADSSEWELGD
jgi:hypothetical protein